jgi:hypothetical protein
MHRKRSFHSWLIFVLSFYFLVGCTSNNPEPTGTFTATFSGNFSEELEGTARFFLQPSGINGILFILLRETNEKYIQITIPNTDPVQILLEPGTYTIVPQLGNDILSEVLVDYVDGPLSFTATSGQLKIGISKSTQISGQIENAEFNILMSTCNGTFDAIPEL